VALLAYSGAVPFDFVTVAEVFSADPSKRFGEWYDMRVCGLEPGPVALGAGVTVEATHGFEDAARADLVIVPGWHRSSERPPGELVEAVRQAGIRGARVMSVCTGAFVLGYAGLLDGRRSTTHWSETDALADRFPRTTVLPRALFVDEGAVLTSAGMSAGIDLALHLVRSEYGAAAAHALASRLVLAAYRTGGQTQFVDRPNPTEPADPVIALLEWMRTHLDREQPLRELAARVHVSPRTLTRQFRAVTGTTPHQWLIRERIIAVQRLLETSDEPIEMIGRQAGFPSAPHLRNLFRRHVGTSPQGYRIQFRARGAANDRH
jgi:AraC family transcriptional activator FtrA